MKEYTSAWSGTEASNVESYTRSYVEASWKLVACNIVSDGFYPKVFYVWERERKEVDGEARPDQDRLR